MPGDFGLILLIICLSTPWTFAQPQKSVTAAQEWKRTYSKVFAKSAADLSTAEVASHLMYLHKAILVADLDNSVTDDMKDNVVYSYGLLSDIDTTHCNTKQLDKAKRRLLSITNANPQNLDHVLELAHRNLVEICADFYRPYEATLEKRLPYWDNIRFLRPYRRAYKKFAAGELTKYELKVSILNQLGVKKRDSKQDIIELWNTRRCGRLLSVIKEYDMDPIKEFAALYTYIVVRSRDENHDRFYKWAKLINACDKLNMMIADFSKKEPKKPSRFVRLFKKD